MARGSRVGLYGLNVRNTYTDPKVAAKSMAAVCIANLCRICYTKNDATHRTLLFGAESVKVKLASRLNKLLNIPLEKDERLPLFIYRSCKTKFLRLKPSWKTSDL